MFRRSVETRARREREKSERRYNKLPRRRDFLVTKRRECESRSSKSFHRPSLSIDKTLQSRHDVTLREIAREYEKCKNTTSTIPLRSDVPRFKKHRAMRDSVEICTTLTAAARAVPDLSFPFPPTLFFFFFWPLDRPARPSLLTCVLCVRW